MKDEKVTISVVATVYNSSYVVEDLVNSVASNVLTITESYEIILVDDNSLDDSWQVIEKIANKNPRIKAIKLSRNFGQQLATSAGMRFAKGDFTIIMDGDLQNPPEAIPLIIEELKKGYDVVYTISKTRNNWKDEITSEIFWFIINRLLKVGMVPHQLMMKGFTKNFLQLFNSYNEKVRVIAGIVHDIGLRFTVLEVENRRRKKGKGNYNFFKRFHLMIEIILALTQKPLEILINISLLSLSLSLLIGLYTAINYIVYPDTPPGYTTVVILMVFFGSLNTLLLGIIGRYLSNIYIEVRNRPLYLISEKINL